MKKVFWTGLIGIIISLALVIALGYGFYFVSLINQAKINSSTELTIESTEITEVVEKNTEPPSLITENLVEENWFDDVLFIGDSRTVGMRATKRLGKADYFCKSNMSVFTVQNWLCSDNRFTDYTLEEVLKTYKYKKIFIELGINECGYDHNLIIEYYQNLIDLIYKYQPNSAIIIQSVITLSEQRTSDPQFSLERIDNLNKLLYNLAQKNQTFYLNPNNFAADEEGYLRSDLSNDGCHFHEKGYTEWINFIMSESSKLKKDIETMPLKSLFDEEISFEWEYTMLEDTIPYMLFSPNKIPNQPLPLIIWLHGSGERDLNFQSFKSRGLPNILSNWHFEHFYAYVLCPHLTGSYNTGAWYLESSRENLNNLINKIIQMYNIDTSNIIICGHSLGAQGALYMVDKNPELYSKLAVFSGYHPDTDMSNINIPTIGFAGFKDYGEDAVSAMFHNNSFALKFGKEATTWVPCGHGQVPDFAFALDKNNNNRSDIIEWMLEY